MTGDAGKRGQTYRRAHEPSTHARPAKMIGASWETSALHRAEIREKTIFSSWHTLNIRKDREEATVETIVERDHPQKVAKSRTYFRTKQETAHPR